MSEQNVQVSVEQALEIALQAHVDGYLDTAEQIYGKVLAGEPDNPPALHYLGVLKYQRGQPEEALTLVERAIANAPLNAAYYNSCGEIYRFLGRLEEAEERVKIALRLKPDYVEALENLAALSVVKGDIDSAENALRRAIELQPDYAEGHNNLGALYEAQGRLEEAMHAYEQALRLKPSFAEARVNLARMLAASGQIFEALERYEIEFSEAVGQLEALLATNPDDAQGHDRLGVALQLLGRMEEALQHHLEAVRLSPDLAYMHINLGNALQRLGRPEEAREAYQRALELNPDDIVAHVNLGNVLHTLGCLDEAVSHFDAALRQRPDLPEARYNLALVNLARGEYSTAWRDYMLRHGDLHGILVDKPSEPLPTDLTGRHILLVPDQGFGDELFFMRFAPELVRRGARLTYATATKMFTVISRLPFLSQVVNDASQIKADLKLSIGDLPYLTGMTSAEQTPSSLQLAIEPHALARVKERLASARRPLLGVTWRAGVDRDDVAWRGKKRTLKKAVPSDQLAEALRDWPGEILILQRQPAEDERSAFLEALDRPALDFSDLNDDLEQMLALLSLLDEYIAVSNTNLHLRAGLGKSTRVLIPLQVMDWRWPMRAGARSVWFPECPLYHQAADGGWADSLNRLKEDLGR